MKVRVFDPKPTQPSSAFAPQATPLLGGRESSLVVQLGPAPGQVPYGDLAALSVFRTRAEAGESIHLLFFLNGRPRPLRVEAGQIRFQEFPFQLSTSDAENVRQVAIHLCRQSGSLLLDRPTVGFLKSGGTPPRLETGVEALATAFGKTLMPEASSALSPHQTRPLGAPPAASPQPEAQSPGAPPALELGPAPVSTQRMSAVAPEPPPAAPPPPVPPPAVSEEAVSEEPGREFRPMEIRVFDPALRHEDRGRLPREVSRIASSARGLELYGESESGDLSFGDVEGLATFRNREQGTEKTYLMLVARGQARPLLAPAPRIVYDAFPIRVSASEPENLRQWALYVCQKAGRMVTDRATGRFLQQGGEAPLLERGILALATSFCAALPRPGLGA